MKARPPSSVHGITHPGGEVEGWDRAPRPWWQRCLEKLGRLKRGGWRLGVRGSVRNGHREAFITLEKKL